MKLETWAYQLDEVTRRQIYTSTDVGKKMHSFWKQVNRNTEINIKRHGIENFMDFSEIRNTMLVMDKDVAEHQLSYIKEREYLDHETLLQDKVLGDNHPQKIHSLYHLYNFIESGGKVPKTGHIVEIGPGIGTMADLIIKSGFVGTYHLLDSETFNSIQTYYLTENGSNNKLEFIGTKSNKVSMLIGLWSLSEFPLDDRLIANYSADQYLLAYGPSFMEIDNNEYFNWFKESREDVSWKTVPAITSGQNYLFGLRNKAGKK